MEELSLHVLDLTDNALTANAKLVEVYIIEEDDLLKITVKDDGCGMDKDTLKKVVDGCYTTKNGRDKGRGLFLLKKVAETCDGSFSITSEKNVGTTVCATFSTDNRLRPPLGNIAETVMAIAGGLKESDLLFYYDAFGQKFSLDTRLVRKELGDIEINAPEILVFLREMIKENIKTNSEVFHYENNSRHQGD